MPRPAASWPNMDMGTRRMLGALPTGKLISDLLIC